MKRFWEWFKKKENVWQNIQYKKSNRYIFIQDKTDSKGGIFRITDEHGKIDKQAVPFIMTAMIEYLIEKDEYDNLVDKTYVKHLYDVLGIEILYNDLKQKIEEL